MSCGAYECGTGKVFLQLTETMSQVTDYLYKRVVAQKNAEVRRLKELHSSLLQVSSSTHYDAAHEVLYFCQINSGDLVLLSKKGNQ